MVSLIDYTGNNKTGSSYWAKRIKKVLGALFDPTSAMGYHAPSEVRDSNAITATIVDLGSGITDNLWIVHQTRKAVFEDIEQMDASEETVSTSLDIIADSAMSFSDTKDTPLIDFTCKNDKVKGILNRLKTRTNMESELWQIYRDAFKHSNEFREIVINRQTMQVTAIKQTVSYQVYPNTDTKGNKLPGWVVINDSDIYTNTKGVQLEEWQICPFIFGSRHGFLAVPALASARRNWKRLAKMEDGMALARLIRAYDKLVHKIPVKPEMSSTEILTRIKQYKDAVTKKRAMDDSGMLYQNDSPLDVHTDFYLPDDGTNRGGVELLSSNNAQLGNLADVIYHREKLLTRLQVPISYLQITSAQKTHLTSGATKTANVEIQFARMLRRLQLMANQGFRRVCDIELMLNGVTPSEDLYTINLSPIVTKDVGTDAEITLTYAQAAYYLVQAFGALPPELLAAKFLVLDTNQSKLLDSFMNEFGSKMTKAKIKAMTPTQPKIEPGNSSASAKTPSIKAEPKTQTIDLGDFVDLLCDLQETVNDDLRQGGVPVPDIDDNYRDILRSGISAFLQDADIKAL